MAEIARKTGYMEGSVSPYLRQDAKASSKFINRVAEAFGFDAKEILASPVRLPNEEPTTIKKVKYPDFGANLLQLRKSQKMTQDELVEKLGVARGAYAMWEGGFSRPDPAVEKQIATFYGTTVDDLHNTQISTRKRLSGDEIDYKSKYFELLQQQESDSRTINLDEAMRMVEIAAKAAANAVADQLGRRLEELAANLDGQLAENQAVQLYLADLIGGLAGAPPASEIVEALDNAVMDAAVERNRSRRPVRDR